MASKQQASSSQEGLHLYLDTGHMDCVFYSNEYLNDLRPVASGSLPVLMKTDCGQGQKVSAGPSIETIYIIK